MSAPATPARRSRALFLGFWLALWLAQVLPVRVIADDALDPSWSQALGRFLAQGLAIGRDYVFTYGPLGYFSTNVYEPALFWQKLLLWEVGWRLVASWFVARALWDGHSRAVRIGALLLVLLVPLLFDAFAFAVIVSVANVLAREERPGALVRGLGYLMLASLALVKFTFAVAAGASAAALVLHALAHDGRRRALLDAACALGGLGACWIASAGGISNFLPWLSKSLAIASAYNEGESKPAGAFSTWIGLATLGCALALIARYALERPRSLVRGFLAAALLLDCFLAFKAGYVRGDDHTTYYLGFALFACLILPRTNVWLAGIAAALALAGILGAPEQEGAAPATLLRDFVARLPLNARDVFLPWIPHAELERNRALRAARFDLPRIRARVGQDPIDVFNYHQGVALLNGLDYVPRPLFQSYVAFTPHLQDLDVRFYESAQAPRWVLFKLETIDDRLPTSEHARLFETLLRWYRPVLSERRELLLERRAQPLPPARRTTELEREAAFGEELVLPPTHSAARLLTLDIRLRTIGRLAQFLYRAPEIHLESVDQFGNRRSLRVVPGLMRTGVLVDPYVAAGDGWVQFLVGAPEPRLRSMRVVIPAGWEWMYEPKFGVRLEGTEGFAPPRDDALSRELGAFVFERMPDGLSAPQSVLRLENLGRDCFYVFAPASMAWTLPAGKHSLQAVFGLSTDPRRLPSSLKACFRVGLVQGQQQRLLMERWVDLTKPEDRGLLQLDLEFEATADCQLVLATALPEGDATKNAWCFWSGVKIDAPKK